MGFRFRKSAGGKHFKVSLNSKSVGATFGVPGAHVTLNSKGQVTGSAGIPGSGAYFVKSKNIFGKSEKENSSETADDEFDPNDERGIGEILREIEANSKKHENESQAKQTDVEQIAPAPKSSNKQDDNITVQPSQPNASQQKSPKKDGTVKSFFKKHRETIYSILTIIFLIFFFPIGLYLMWAKTKWNKWVKIVISVVFAVIVVYAIASPSEDTTESEPSSEESSYTTEAPESTDPSSQSSAAVVGTVAGADKSTSSKETTQGKETTTKKETTTRKEVTTNGITTTTKPNEITVILNTQTGVYHLSSGCRAAQRIDPANRKEISVKSTDEIESSYKPCGICAD